MEERQRVKIVDYVGTKKVDQSKIEEKLKDAGIQIRLDSFIDPGTAAPGRRDRAEVYAAQGYQFAEVKPEVKEVSGGPKLVHVTFNIDEGPKVRIREVDFVGNKAIGDGRSPKDEGEQGPGHLLVRHRRRHLQGRQVRGRCPERHRLLPRSRLHPRAGRSARAEDPRGLEGQQTRWVQLRIPVTEGKRYKIGKFEFEGNKVVNSEALRPLFKLNGRDLQPEEDQEGDREGPGGLRHGRLLRVHRLPDLKPRDDPARAPAPPTAPKATATAPTVRPSRPPPSPRRNPSRTKNGQPVVDVTMRIQEGKQYFVNRITFIGNTTTRDNVIRREMRLVEGGVFNTEALKYSVRRLNQLGYFKPLEGKAIDVQKTPGVDNKVDVQLKFEEQNRNQLTFGAGVSQFDGFFGQLVVPDLELPRPRRDVHDLGAAGRPREELSGRLHRAVPLRSADDGRRRPLHPRDQLHQPIHAGIEGRQRRLRLPGRAGRARMFVNYSLENVKVKDLNPLYLSPLVRNGNPFLEDSLLIGQGGTARSARSVRASSTTRSTARSSRPPASALPCRSTSRASAATRTS